jgi:hypothetical protein
MPIDRLSLPHWSLLLGIIVVSGFVAGCSRESSAASSAVFATTVIGEPVVQAVETALKISGYRLTERTDVKETHESPRQAIHGERYGMSTAFGPGIVHINVVVTPVEKGSHIQVDVIPPNGAYGTSAIPLHDYHYALSQLLHDLAVKSTSTPSSWF